jgi:hypothetical protein
MEENKPALEAQKEHWEDTLSERADKSQALGLSVNVLCHDVRDPLPFRDESFDECYSHMLYCMALTMHELEVLSDGVWRVLHAGAINRKGDPSRRGSIRGRRLCRTFFQRSGASNEK